MTARLYNPSDVAVDADGNLYIADYDNYRVRKVDTSGVITTFAGTGSWGNTGDDGPADLARLSRPLSLALDADGRLFISDLYNQRIRVVEKQDLFIYAPTGAGGSIFMDVGSIQVSGSTSRITANGGGDWDLTRHHTGAGGRVSLTYNQDLGFDPNRIAAHGGPSAAPEAYLGAAGTVYIQQADGTPALKVANFDPIAGQKIDSDQATLMEVVGRQPIEVVTNLGGDRWLIEIDGTLVPHRTYAGYWIDPKASDHDGPYYKIVATRGLNGLILETSDDLAALAGDELVGIHEIAELEIVGQASAEFGDDRIWFSNGQGLQAAAGTSLQTG
jgi:hypothetical protein